MALACLLARCTRGSVHAQAADSLEEAIELHRGFKQAHETWTKIGKVCSCMTLPAHTEPARNAGLFGVRPSLHSASRLSALQAASST